MPLLRRANHEEIKNTLKERAVILGPVRLHYKFSKENTNIKFAVMAIGVKKATDRNTIKRKLKETFRLAVKSLKTPGVFVLASNTRLIKEPFQNVIKLLDEFFRKKGLFDNTPK